MITKMLRLLIYSIFSEATYLYMHYISFFFSMKLDQVTLYEVNIPRKSPFVTSRATQTHVNSIILELNSEGYVGLGEATPRSHINGETVISTRRDLRYLTQVVKFSDDPLEYVRKANSGPSGKFAYESALLDIFSQQEGLPICDYLNENDKEEIDYAGLISSNVDGSKLIKKARSLAQNDAKIIRLKVGPNLDKECERVYNIRKSIGFKTDLWLDPNQSWNLDDLKGYLKDFEKLDIMMFEQPFPSEDYASHEQLRWMTPILVMMDESVQTRQDLEKVLGLQCADAVNIKPLKIGSIMETMELAKMAASKEVGVYCGGTAATDIFAATMRHFEFANSENVQYYSSGKPRSKTFAIEKSITTPVLEYSHGMTATRPIKPGLGLKLNHKELEKYTVNKWEVV